MHTALTMILSGGVLPAAPQRLLRPSRVSWPGLLGRFLPQPVIPSLHLWFLPLRTLPGGEKKIPFAKGAADLMVHEVVKMKRWQGVGRACVWLWVPFQVSDAPGWCSQGSLFRLL